MYKYKVVDNLLFDKLGTIDLNNNIYKYLLPEKQNSFLNEIYKKTLCKHQNKIKTIHLDNYKEKNCIISRCECGTIFFIKYIKNFYILNSESSLNIHLYGDMDDDNQEIKCEKVKKVLFFTNPNNHKCEFCKQTN